MRFGKLSTWGKGVFGAIMAVGLSAGFQATALAQAVVDLQILNTANSSGEIVISKGNDVLVGFAISGESSKNDELQLVRLDGSVVSKIKRGVSEVGNGSLHTNANNAIATLQVKYVQEGVVVATAPNQVTVVADEGSIVLSQQIADLQEQLSLLDQAQGAAITQLQADLAAANATIVTLQTQIASLGAANLAALEASVTTLEAQAVNIPTNSQGALLTDLAQHVAVVQGDLNMAPGPHILFTGANVHIRSGSGSTNDGLSPASAVPIVGTPTGLGNLIIGYNEIRNVSSPKECADGQYDNEVDCVNAGHVWNENHRSGSHSLIMGRSQNYSRTSNVLFASDNSAIGDQATVTGGRGGVARGFGTSVSGGILNTAIQEYDSVSGGRSNIASGAWSHVSGGRLNQATGLSATVSGGRENEANHVNSTVSGGQGIVTTSASQHVP